MSQNVIRPVDTPPPLADCFARLGLAVRTWSHAPVFTVGEGEDIKRALEGGQTKNLFLRDRRGDFWLVTALASTVIDLKGLSDTLDCPRFSFGSPDELRERLGVLPGSVTPFALINDKNLRVRPVFDRAMMDFDVLNFHPLRNDMTTAISPPGLMAFAADCGHHPMVFDFLSLSQAKERQHGA